MNLIDNSILLGTIATICTWLLTALGAGCVFFLKKVNKNVLNIMLGFASGIMIAASFWSLLQPAIEIADEKLAIPSWFIVAIGFITGALFIYISDRMVSKFQKFNSAKKTESLSFKNKRIFMLMLSITLHNIPEGLAVGVAFGAIASSQDPKMALLAAISVAIGIGLQNFPEGAAISLPLRADGFSRKKSFLYGQASGLVEPIAGFLGAYLVIYIQNLLPFALSFAAGAMILVAVHELIPECQSNNKKYPYLSTMGIIIGFSLMMILDVMLG